MGFEYHKETPEEKIYNKKKSMGLNETLYFLNDILPDKADYVMKALNVSLPYENAEKQPMYVLYAWAFCTEINREEFRNKSLPFVTICEKGNSPFEYPDSYAISVKEGNYKKFLTMLDTGKVCNPFFTENDIEKLKELQDKMKNNMEKDVAEFEELGEDR